jgi:hypothetical protein
MSGGNTKRKITIKGIDGEEIELPCLDKGKYVRVCFYLDVERDWRIIQLLYSVPSGTRTKMLKDILRMVVNAAFLWAERQPLIRAIKTGKKLTEEERRKLLRSRLSLV